MTPTRDDLNRVAAYLARRDRDRPGPADVLVLCGSAVLSAIEAAAAAFRDHLAARILVSGGVGHSTRYLQAAVRNHPRYRDTATGARPESAVIADILRTHHGVPDAAILVEEKSTNCGENARFSVDLLMREPRRVRSVLLIQDPMMQRRTHESFHRSLGGASDITVLSYAPLIPAVRDEGAAHVEDDDGTPIWSMDRFTALLLGEIRRLHDDENGYGPRGADFIDHVDIPTDVLDAYRRLAATFPEITRPAWRPAE